MSVSQSVARPVRTTVQGGAAFAVTEFIDAFGIVQMDERQYGACAVILTIVFSWAQTLIENGLGKGFLRRVPGTKVDVIDNG
jgi:hypothetical protein